MKRSAFFISDGTGITAETLGQSLLAQFENITFSKFTRPSIASVEKARAMVQQINIAAEKDGFRPIIFDTIVNQLAAQNALESTGVLVTPGDNLQVRVSGAFRSPKELEEMQLRANGTTFRLGDLVSRLSGTRRVADCASGQLTAAALGRETLSDQSCTMQAVRDAFATSGSFGELFKNIVESPGFILRDPKLAESQP
jgi:Cu/Ag efflux pump CusA